MRYWICLRTNSGNNTIRFLIDQTAIAKELAICRKGLARKVTLRRAVGVTFASPGRKPRFFSGCRRRT